MPVGFLAVAVTTVFVAMFSMTAVLAVPAVFPVVMAGLRLGFVPVAMLSMTLVSVLGVGAVVVAVFAVAMLGMCPVTAVSVPAPMTVSPMSVIPVMVFRIERGLGEPDQEQQDYCAPVQGSCVVEQVVRVDGVQPAGDQG